MEDNKIGYGTELDDGTRVLYARQVDERRWYAVVAQEVPHYGPTIKTITITDLGKDGLSHRYLSIEWPFSYDTIKLSRDWADARADHYIFWETRTLAGPNFLEDDFS